MLNAFNARSIFEFPAKDRTRIESLLAYGDKLLLGLSTGALRIYRVDSPDSPDVSLELLRTIEGFSRVKIEILACIKEAGILVSLSDGNVNIHDLTDFSLTDTLNKARRASALAVTSNIERDEETGIPEIVSRLAVGVKRRLLLYSWHDGGFQEGKEVTLVGNIRSLTWASGKKVIVGMQSGFVTVDAMTGVAEEIVPPAEVNGGAKGAAENGGWASYVGMGGWGSRSLSTRLSGKELLLVKDSTTLFVDAEGKPLPEKRPMPWSTPPDAVAFSYPYLMSLHSGKQHLEVRDPSTRTLLQTIPLPNVSNLHVPPPNVALVHAGKLFYVASPTQVWRMGATDYETQINSLVEAEHLDEAINLIAILEDVLLKERKDERLREVQMLKATKLFEKKKYEESMALFAEVSAPPERVIKLFPPVIAGDLSIWPEEEAEDAEDAEDAEVQDGEEQPPTEETPETTSEERAVTEEAAEDARKSSEEPPEQDNGEEPIETKSQPPSPTGESTPVKLVSGTATPERKKSNGTPVQSPTDQAPLKNIAFTRKYGDAASIFSFGARRVVCEGSDNASIATKEEGPAVPEAPKPLEGDDLKEAAQELAGLYLNDVRRKLTKYFDSEGKTRDPAGILANGNGVAHPGGPEKDPLEASFLQIDGASSMDLPDIAKVRIQKVEETSKIIDTTLFRTYILIRPSMVGSLVRIQNRVDPEVVSEKLREQGKFEDLVDFLERKKLHREALELLRFFGQAEDDTKAPTLHGPQRTITYLERLKAEHIDLILEFSRWPLETHPELAMEVFVGDTGNSDMLPRPRVLNYLENLDQRLAVQYLEHIINELNDATPEFHTRLARLYLAIISSLPVEEKRSWHARFLSFLTESTQYRAEKVYSCIPRDLPEYFEARAVVLSKMGRHQAALEIYVFKLFDHDKAEAYCLKLYLASPPKDPADSIFHVLLSLYLRPPTLYAPQLGPALRILARHGARLDASEALKLVPPETQIEELESYFLARIRAATSTLSENRIEAALRKARLLDVQEEFLNARNDCAVVGEESVCPACHKRLGLSVIWRLSNGQVVHYGCARRGL